jgi:hypothetical protein
MKNFVWVCFLVLNAHIYSQIIFLTPLNPPVINTTPSIAITAGMVTTVL